jgi:hypothetical protein
MQTDAQRQRKYRATHREELNRRERARRATSKGKAASAHYAHAHLNERNNRLWNQRSRYWLRSTPSRHYRETASIVSLDKLRNPSFRTVGLGHRKREFLFDALPGAHAICANLPMGGGLQNARA